MFYVIWKDSISVCHVYLDMRKIHIIVKLRSRSRYGEGQVRVRKVKETKDLDLRYTIFLVFTHPPPSTAHKLFSWLLRGLDKSDGPRMGWYDFSMVREG